MKTIEELESMDKKHLAMRCFMAQSEVESCRVTAQSCRQSAIDAKIDLETQEIVSEKLWRLLDDIDTASDMFKPCDKNRIEIYKNFYKYVMDKQDERWTFMITDKNNSNKLIINPEFS